MPRSTSKWASLRQMEFIEDLLASGKPFQLSQVSRYFSCDTSHASMAMSGYRDAGGMLPVRVSGFVQDGTFRKGSPRNGASAWFLPPADFRPILGSSEARQAAWAAIKGEPATNLNEWLFDRMLDYLDDGGRDVGAYFGMDATKATRHYNALPGSDGMKRRSTEARRQAWEVWRG